MTCAQTKYCQSLSLNLNSDLNICTILLFLSLFPCCYNSGFFFFFRFVLFFCRFLNINYYIWLFMSAGKVSYCWSILVTTLFVIALLSTHVIFICLSHFSAIFPNTRPNFIRMLCGPTFCSGVFFSKTSCCYM